MSREPAVLTESQERATALLVGLLSLEGDDEGLLWDPLEDFACDALVDHPSPQAAEAEVTALCREAVTETLTEDNEGRPFPPERLAANRALLAEVRWDSLARLLLVCAKHRLNDNPEYAAFRALLLSRDVRQACWLLTQGKGETNP